MGDGEGSEIEEKVKMDRHKKVLTWEEGGVKNSKKSANVLYGRLKDWAPERTRDEVR